jgi:hypothetical protein
MGFDPKNALYPSEMAERRRWDMTGSLFRQADWLTSERVRRIAVIFAVIAALLLAGDFWMRTRAGVADVDGDQIGRDFVNYWSGAKLAAQGIAAKAYDLDFFVAFQRAHTVPNGTLRWYGANTQDISSRLRLSNGGAATLDPRCLYGRDRVVYQALQLLAAPAGVVPVEKKAEEPTGEKVEEGKKAEGDQ